MAMNGVPMEFADDVCSMKNPKSLTEVSKIEAADVWSASSQYVKERQQVIQVHFYVDEHGKISYKIGGCSKAVLSLKSIVVKHVYFIYLGELEHPEDATSVTESNWKILKFLGGAGKSLTLAGFLETDPTETFLRRIPFSARKIMIENSKITKPMLEWILEQRNLQSLLFRHAHADHDFEVDKKLLDMMVHTKSMLYFEATILHGAMKKLGKQFVEDLTKKWRVSEDCFGRTFYIRICCGNDLQGLVPELFGKPIDRRFSFCTHNWLGGIVSTDWNVLKYLNGNKKDEDDCEKSSEELNETFPGEAVHYTVVNNLNE